MPLGDLGGRFAVFRHLPLRVVVHKDRHGVFVPGFDRSVKRSVAVVVLNVEVGSVADQHLDSIGVPIHRRGDERSATPLVHDVYVRACGEQRCGAFGGTIGRSYLDVAFPPGFDELYVAADYLLRANALSPSTSEIYTGISIQTDWATAAGVTGAGDVSLGSPNDVGPTTSYAAEGAHFSCATCQVAFPTTGTPFAMSGNTSTLRIGWGEGGGQAEGWYPWYAGSIFVR